MKWSQSLNSILAAFFGVLAGGVFLIIAGYPLFPSLGVLFKAGFGCSSFQNCAILTTLQFATPLIFSGLSAAVAFQVGFFSIGQVGQMILGAGVAAWVGGNTGVHFFHPLFAVFWAAVAGGIWAFIPGILKLFINVNEIITTIVMNSIAGFTLGLIPFRRGLISETARLTPLATGTKLNQGLYLALITLLGVYLFFWRSSSGYRTRMVGQAEKFARYGGIQPKRYAGIAIVLSGMLAGVAGAVEVLGVHYRFITGFSANATFDGVMVALLGQLHPMGVLLAAIFVGGIRLGALNGLLMLAGIPRELGNAILACMTIFMTIDLVGRIKQKKLASYFSRLIVLKSRKKEDIS